MKWLCCLLFSLVCHICMAEPFNIYVKYHDDALKTHIHQFNDFLKNKGIFDKYNIQPFIKTYPLHTTLYLTHFESNSIPNVIEVLNGITKQWHQFDITTSKIYITDNNYVMIDVDYQQKKAGLNPELQMYSDMLVFDLYKLRDTQAPIPDWAKNIPSKQRAYKRYGSPNVFFEFSPHFTLMAKKFKDKQTAQAFHNDMQSLISEYRQRHPDEHITVKATQIGIGHVNHYGQITKEIAGFELPKSPLHA